MPLPTPLLDDRHFQDIVDQAKLLIPHYCREWTDHNVSDPGVTLIELFAWMTDMLLYRVNQVPDKNYLKFLEMIGVQLEEPRAATAPITFYLSAAQPVEVTIPAEYRGCHGTHGDERGHHLYDREGFDHPSTDRHRRIYTQC